MRIALERPQNYRTLQPTHAVAPAAQGQERAQDQQARVQDQARAQVETQGWRSTESSEPRDTSTRSAGVQEPRTSNVGFKWPETASQTITQTVEERNQRYTEEAIRAYTEQNESLEGWQFKASDVATNELGRFSANSEVSTATGGAMAGVGSVIDMRV